MTRHRFLLALLATGVIFFGMSLLAAPGLNEVTVEGTVIRAGNAKLTLLVSASNTLQKFAVASDATISRDGRTAKLEDVAFGDFALISVKDSLVSVKDNEDLRIATVIAAVSPFKRQDGQR